MQHHVEIDLDEGYAHVACLDCRNERAKLEIARPARFYVGSLACCECGSSLIEWDIMTERAA